MSISVNQTSHPMVGEVSTLRGDLGPALAELSTRQRQVLSLRYLAGLDDAEISEAIGISVKAVRKSAAQGISALRSHGFVSPR
jgi:RNA polymerase sigma factor (sigma-70 family)